MSGTKDLPQSARPVRAVVVNDDPTQLAILSALLMKEGLEVLVFPGAENALLAMKGGTPPDLIVTDLFMPGIDGWRFCRLLRSPVYAELNEVPILVISATFTGDEPDRITADLGANGFLPAPVDARRFIDLVRKLLAGKQPLNRLRVLVVEDSAELADLLKEVFEANGYTVDAEDSVEKATRLLGGMPYDVAVLDYHLPDGKGDELLESLRKNQPDCACIMMTTDTGPDLALSFMHRGAAAYVRKPFQMEYLLEQCVRVRRERSLLRSEDLLEMRTRELQASETRYRELVENLNDVIYKVDLDGRLQYISQSVEKLLGVTPAQIVGRPMDFATHPEDKEQLGRSFADLLKGNSTYPNEYRMFSRDGSVKWVRTSTSLVREGRKVTGMQGVLTDITERKHAEQELALSQLRLRLFIDANSDLMYLKDADLRYQMVNAANAAFFGREEGEILGKTDQDLMPGEAARACRETDLQAIREKRTVTAVEAVDGRVYETQKFPVIIDGAVVGVAGLICDITDRMTLEAQLYQAQKMESVGRLAGGVAHDFNNMLSVILGHAEMALDRVPAADPLHADLEEIHKAAGRSAGLTRQLLAFARKQTVAPRVLDLNDTVSGILNMMQRLLGENITLAWLPAPDLWETKVDPSQIDQVLANLCVNARDAIDNVGTITISTGNVTFDSAACASRSNLLPGDYVSLSVSDDGCGMDNETLSQIFEPFFTTKGVGVGTGLGLATVYGAVKQNRGFIDAASEKGRGTSITIYLPRHTGKTDQAQPGAQAVSVVRCKETILLVEDEPAILEMTRGMLERQGYTVLAAGTPGEAMELAREHGGDIHLLMTDVVMPEMNGRDLARNILSLYPNLHRLFMSGYTADVIAHHGVLDEGVYFIQKPFGMKEMTAKVREVLDGK